MQCLVALARSGNYASIGDDIAIANEAVVQEYSLLLGRLGVSISIPRINYITE